MEFKDYLKLINKHKKLFLSIWAVVVLGSFLFLWGQARDYQTKMTIIISRQDDTKIKQEKILTNKEYDYYYRLESDKMLNKIVFNSLQDKVLLQKVFISLVKNRQLEQNLTNREKHWIEQKLKAKELGASSLEITIRSHYKNLVQPLANVLSAELKNKLSKISDNNNQIIVKAEMTTVVITSKQYFLILTSSVIIGFLLASLSVLSLHYKSSVK